MKQKFDRRALMCDLRLDANPALRGYRQRLLEERAKEQSSPKEVPRYQELMSKSKRASRAGYSSVISIIAAALFSFGSEA